MSGFNKADYAPTRRLGTAQTDRRGWADAKMGFDLGKYPTPVAPGTHLTSICRP